MKYRYRQGQVAGYASRLHYFSDWMVENEKRKQLNLVMEILGGTAQSSKVHFMSSNHQQFFKLQDNPENLQAIFQTEQLISNISGLDVIHTGIAYWNKE
ncbi:hypothetical protein GZ78_11345 [Endozoicomonas numazuensis]|uniref:Uncharacterized protein n=2 Tax=Endozoicomonas numazuensis TaxID=1137799 RepID=A0A081NI72_9GAMM|nr:hypothetical protein GZ78_11345 [Endozoicomonas numazuensis]